MPDIKVQCHGASNIKRLKAPEDENANLKKLFTKVSLKGHTKIEPPMIAND